MKKLYLAAFDMPKSIGACLYRSTRDRLTSGLGLSTFPYPFGADMHLYRIRRNWNVNILRPWVTRSCLLYNSFNIPVPSSAMREANGGRSIF